MRYETIFYIEKAEEELQSLEKELADVNQALASAYTASPGTIDVRSLQSLCESLEARRKDLREQLDTLTRIVDQLLGSRYRAGHQITTS